MMDSSAPRILGDFKILRELGRGGMGVVYLARQLSLAREVALKVLSQEAGVEEELILRFQREASLLGRMSHPHIVRVFVVGEEDGRHFLAMEYVDGTNLEQVLEARRTGRHADLPREFQEDFLCASVRAARDTARALAAAHAQGIVHRDVKPSNILIDRQGRVLLADFGLARDLSNRALTRSGAMLGTPFYMSPERFRVGDPAPTSDVYALGAVLYECAVGRRAFDDVSAERLMAMILHDDPAPPRKLNPQIEKDLETIILTCMEKDVGRRYPDGGALARDLTRFLEGEAIEAEPAGPVTRFVRRARRRRAPLLLLLSTVLLAAIALAWGWFERDSRQASRARAAIESALNSDDLERALLLMDEFLEADPGDEQVRFERAELALREKRWEDAAVDFRYLAVHSRSEGVAAKLGEQLATAILAEQSGQGFSLEPPAEVRTARAAYYRSLILQARGELEPAVAACRRALELDPGYTKVLYSLGAVLFKQRDYPAAEEVLLKYDQRFSRASVMNMLGRIDMENAKYESACVNFGRYTRAAPGDVVGWNNLAAAHAQQAMRLYDRALGAEARAEKEAAFVALKRARELEPDYFLVAFNDAVLHIIDREIEQAEELFQRAIQLYNEKLDSDQDWGLRMWLQFPEMLNWAQAYDRALFYLEGLRKEQPEFENQLLWVLAFADAKAATGETDQALAAIDKALSGPLKGNPQLLTIRDILTHQEE